MREINAPSMTWEEVSRGGGSAAGPGHRLGRNQLPWALEEAVRRRQLTDPDQIALGIEDAWTGAEFPMGWLKKADWAHLFTLTGYLEDGHRASRPLEPVTLYRGATRGLRYRWSWSDSRERAEWFRNRLRNGGADGRLWTMTAEPGSLLAHFSTSRNEAEWVVNPVGLKVKEVL